MKGKLAVALSVVGVLTTAGALTYKKYEDTKVLAGDIAMDFIGEINSLSFEQLTLEGVEFQPKTKTFIIEVKDVIFQKSHWVQLKLNCKKEVTHIVEFGRNSI